jgi:hypothetical protein
LATWKGIESGTPVSIRPGSLGLHADAVASGTAGGVAAARCGGGQRRRRADRARRRRSAVAAGGWGVTQGAEGLLDLTTPQVVSVRLGDGSAPLRHGAGPEEGQGESCTLLQASHGGRCGRASVARSAPPGQRGGCADAEAAGSREQYGRAWRSQGRRSGEGRGRASEVETLAVSWYPHLQPRTPFPRANVMPLAITCPGCGKGYNLPANIQGKKVRCVQCRAEFIVALRPTVASDGGLRRGGTGAGSVSGRN